MVLIQTSQHLRGANQWNRTVAALQVSAFEVILLPGLEIAEGLEVTCALMVLFGKPDLIAPEDPRA